MNKKEIQQILVESYREFVERELSQARELRSTRGEGKVYEPDTSFENFIKWLEYESWYDL